MGQAPSYQSFPLMSGDNQQLEFTVVDRNGAIVDLTGGSGRFVASRSPLDSVLVLDSAASPSSATVTIINPLTGRVDVLIDDVDTDALSGDYYYEFKWTDVLGREAVVARGIMSFADNLT